MRSTCSGCTGTTWPATQQPRERARARRAARVAHRGRRPDRGGVRQPVPDDRRPQGARRLLVPGAPAGDRPLRPHACIAPCGPRPATTPRRCGDLAHHGLPRRGRAAREHEPRALRVARPVGRRPGRRHPHARARRATSRRSTTSAHVLAVDPTNFILNQFSEFSNHLGHYTVTGQRWSGSSTVMAAGPRQGPAVTPRLAAFVSASGSAGTLAAGDYLKDAPRHPYCGRRGPRMPDDALQRIRRAQHPRHRRQAHPADPQRDEHRLGRGRLRPGVRRAGPGLQHSRGDGRPARPSRRRSAGDRRPSGLRALVDLQRARGHQGRQAGRARPRRRDRHRGHRRRRVVRVRASAS